MIGGIVENIIIGNDFYALEVFERDGLTHYNLVQMRLKKDELDIVQSYSSGKMENLKDYVKNDKPLFLAINTPQVLRKVHQDPAPLSAEVILTKCFPNMDFEQFYYEVAQSNAFSIVNLAKKDEVDNLLSELKIEGINPFKISLGVGGIQTIGNIHNGQIYGSNFNLTALDNSITSFNTGANQNEGLFNDIGGLKIKPQCLLGVAMIIGHVQSVASHSNLTLLNETSENSFKNHKVWTIGKMAVPLIFVGILLINFLFFNSYHQKKVDLESENSTSLTYVEEIKVIKERIKSKGELLALLESSKNNRISFYLDEIGLLLPTSIRLEQMQFQPLRKPAKKDKPIELKEESLIVKGTSNDRLAFTIWSDNLESQKWIKKVEILDFSHVGRTKAEFTLNLVLNGN